MMESLVLLPPKQKPALWTRTATTMTTMWQVFVLLGSSDSLGPHLTARFHSPYRMDFSTFCSYPEAAVELVLKADSGCLIQIKYWIVNLHVKCACCNSRKSISGIILWFTQNPYRQNQTWTFQEGTMTLTICSKGHCFQKCVAAGLHELCMCKNCLWGLY